MPAPEPTNIRLSGPAWWPPGYGDMPTAARLAWWRLLAGAALGRKRREILSGIGADGRKLKRVKRSSRPDGAAGPPLAPHDLTSRTYRLLAPHADADGATLFWRGGWKRILGYHAYKRGPRALPVRNTIGISPAGRAAALAEAIRAWRGRPRPLSPRAEQSRRYDPRSRKIQVIVTPDRRR